MLVVYSTIRVMYGIHHQAYLHKKGHLDYPVQVEEQ